MTVADLLDRWRRTPAVAANVAAWRTFPAQPAQTAPLPGNLHPLLLAALRRQGIDALYSHQAETWATVQAGGHPALATGTASGKTLAYNLPVLQRLITNPQACALYLFPTKALARDQGQALHQLVIDEQGQPALKVAAYDGDTPRATRPAIRRNSRLLLTNPDMLHTAILPHHTKWARFLGQLHFVVIDEMHVYRGVFGSHVANVLRRLKRIAQFYRAAPQFILTSATIANPTELAERLIEAPVTLIDQDGAAHGPRDFLIYNPPVIDQELGVRRSLLAESSRLAQELLEQTGQTIIFGRTRRTVEALLRHIQAKSPAPLRAYRSGYLPQQRREIEQELRDGAVQGVVSTTALELGLDIGQMMAALLVGYPGTIAAAWQQAGRAGRGSAAALAVLVVSAGPLDQFLAHQPDYFFSRSPEQALINPDNLFILLQHLRCAAFELPFQVDDPFGRVSAAHVADFLAVLAQSGEIHRSRGRYFWMAARYPAEAVSLRSASPEQVQLLAGNDEAGWQTIGQVDRPSAPWLVHPEAIYLHQGQAYRVLVLDLDQAQARLEPVEVDYFTEPKRETEVELGHLQARAPVPAAIKSHGEIVVTSRVSGYNKVQWFSNERLGSGELDLPPEQLPTTGYWLTLEPAAVEQLRAQGFWSSDPNRYGPNWAQQRQQARARDGYRCQLCGAPEQGRAHDVHHKMPFRTFSSYQAANRLSNLITLCRPCHRRAETAVRMRSGLSGLATILGHLAPLFLMCDRRDVGVYADAQAPLAGDQPTVLIYDKIPAGLGFSERLFERHAELVQQAHALTAACSCAAGCPSCVGPAGEAGTGGKQETLAILALLVGEARSKE